MKINFLLFALTLIILRTNDLMGQTIEQCHTSHLLEEQNSTNPQTLQQRRSIEGNLQALLGTNPDYRVGGGVVTIPVVIHVVYSQPEVNITMARIQSQLDVLNRDFRKLNADTASIPSVWTSTMADAEIEFCLATVDPHGNPTNGVTRTSTTVTGFWDNISMKFDSLGGKDGWPSDDYLNVWVSNLGAPRGFAQFPGFFPETDGIAIDWRLFGRYSPPFRQGRTLIHEIGHWLNLYHTWGANGSSCSSDFVADTPDQGTWTNGCPNFPLLDSCSPSGSGIMFMNYMDYTNEECLNSFTNGQVARMHATMATSRQGILNSTKCAPLNLQQVDAAIASIESPSGTFCDIAIDPEFVLGNFGSNPLTSCTINYQLDSGTVHTINWTGHLASLLRVTVPIPTLTPPAGPHILKVWVTNPNGGIDGQPSNDQKSTSFNNSYPPTGWAAPINESFEPEFFPPSGWSIENPDSFYTWERISGISAYGVGQGCIRMNGFSYYVLGEEDYLNLPILDLSTSSAAEMSFDVAYSLYNSAFYDDSLSVQVSTNCGNTWTDVYKQGGQGLTTTPVPITGSEFSPTGSEWRTEVLDLTPFANKASVMIRFRHLNSHQNNLYIDNINVNGSVAAQSPLLPNIEFELFPNPSRDRILLTVSDGLHKGTTLRIINSLGGIAKAIEPRSYGQTSLELDVADLGAGIYFLELQTSRGTGVKKFIKSR